ncbi:hypothetical protein HYW17_04315 [Candidatus Uhrbacteria bacterium]|nr:hypothetical protein [Candidatus Uhrbacteria bacterium]
MSKIAPPLPWKEGDADRNPDELQERGTRVCFNCGEPRVVGQPHRCGELDALARPREKAPPQPKRK